MHRRARFGGTKDSESKMRNGPYSRLKFAMLDRENPLALVDAFVAFCAINDRQALQTLFDSGVLSHKPVEVEHRVALMELATCSYFRSFAGDSSAIKPITDGTEILIPLCSTHQQHRLMNLFIDRNLIDGIASCISAGVDPHRPLLSPSGDSCESNPIIGPSPYSRMLKKLNPVEWSCLEAACSILRKKTPFIPIGCRSEADINGNYSGEFEDVVSLCFGNSFGYIDEDIRLKRILGNLDMESSDSPTSEQVAHLLPKLIQTSISGSGHYISTDRCFMLCDILVAIGESAKPSIQYMSGATENPNYSMGRYLLTRFCEVHSAQPEKRQNIIGGVQNLLECGFPVDQRDAQCSDTPLMIAARLGNLELMRLLLDHGARLDVWNAMSETPYMAAKNVDSFDAMALLDAHRSRLAIDEIMASQTPIRMVIP